MDDNINGGGSSNAQETIISSSGTAREIETWIENIKHLHETTARPESVTLMHTQAPPDIELLMQEWPEEVENALNVHALPGPDLDCTLEEYINIICGRCPRLTISMVIIFFSLRQASSTFPCKPTRSPRCINCSHCTMSFRVRSTFESTTTLASKRCESFSLLVDFVVCLPPRRHVICGRDLCVYRRVDITTTQTNKTKHLCQTLCGLIKTIIVGALFGGVGDDLESRGKVSDIDRENELGHSNQTDGLSEPTNDLSVAP